MSTHGVVKTATLLGGAGVRLTLGAAYLLAPSRAARARLAPPTDHSPDARLFVRGFGGHQVATAALVVAGLRRPSLLRTALRFSLLVDGSDAASTLLEAQARGRADRTLGAGVALSALGMAWALAAKALD